LPEYPARLTHAPFGSTEDPSNDLKRGERQTSGNGCKISTAGRTISGRFDNTPGGPNTTLGGTSQPVGPASQTAAASNQRPTPPLVNPPTDDHPARDGVGSFGRTGRVPTEATAPGAKL
jgi:hypothetical protein